VIYVDTSALAKLVHAEPESPALRAHLAERQDEGLISSVVLAVELRRSARREDVALVPVADRVLDQVTLVDLNAGVSDTAGYLPDPSLRSLDAIHVATALLLGDELDTLITYDKRMIAAAEANGIPVASPA
jgi:uncharacterized protein